MQIMITHSSLAHTRVLQFNRWQLLGLLAGLMLVLMMASGIIYNYVFMTAAREGWPVVSSVVKLLVRDEFAQRDRFMRDNLDAMAQKLGEMQAKLVKLDAMGERVAAQVGVVAPQSPISSLKNGQGGPYLPVAQPLTLELVQTATSQVNDWADRSTDIFTLIESRLLERRMEALVMPSSAPIDGPVGSGFGYRHDPFTGRNALHTGLDYPADAGTPILAAAGGLVLNVEKHPEYGQMLEIDHGDGLVTRYAHTQKILAQLGAVIKRGQAVALVGSTGRSTGAHLHFEVLVDGVPQDPARFLAVHAPTVATASSRPLRKP